MGPFPAVLRLPWVAAAPRRGCPLDATVSSLPNKPCSPCAGIGRTRKKKVTLEDGTTRLPRSTAACLVLRGRPVGSPLRAWHWRGPRHPHPNHPREKTGILVSVPRLAGREGASASPCPASSSSSALHQQPKNASAATHLPCASRPPRPPAEGTRNSPSLRAHTAPPPPSETVPCKGLWACSLRRDVPVITLPGTQVSAGAVGAQHPSGCAGHPGSLHTGLELGHWGGWKQGPWPL